MRSMSSFKIKKFYIYLWSSIICSPQCLLFFKFPQFADHLLTIITKFSQFPGPWLIRPFSPSFPGMEKRHLSFPQFLNTIWALVQPVATSSWTRCTRETQQQHEGRQCQISRHCSLYLWQTGLAECAAAGTPFPATASRWGEGVVRVTVTVLVEVVVGGEAVHLTSRQLMGPGEVLEHWTCDEWSSPYLPH